MHACVKNCHVTCFAFRESKGARAQTKQGFQKKPGQQDNRELNEASSWRYLQDQDKTFLYFTSFQIPTEFPLDEEDEDEEEAQEKKATTGEGSKEKTSQPYTRPQLVDEKETSGCSLCRIL